MRLTAKSVFGLLGLFLFVQTASAQTRDAAAAEALFSEGRRAFGAEDYFAACQKFDESQRLDPAAGTLINLAACYEKLGRLASAWESWREALRHLRRDDERRPIVQQRAQALESRLPRLEVQLAADTPPGTSVTRDGVPLGAASLGVALPVDPGKHLVIATAPRHEPAEYVLHLREGETAGVIVEPGNLRREPVQPEAAPAPASSAPPAAVVDDSADAGSERRTLGFVIGGVGIAGLAAGTISGLIALGRKSTVEESCDRTGDRLRCDPAGLDAAESGRTFATLSTVSFALGAAATGVGAWLILTSGNGSTAAAARMLPGGAALALSRRF
jgi:hypothetical protein